MKIYGIYTHAKPNGDIFYVGKGLRTRAFYLDRPRNKWHCNIVNKYGKSSIVIKFYRCKSETHALTREIALIKKLKNKGIKLCNQTVGGDGTSGYRFSGVQIKRLSAAVSKAMKKKWSDPEYRQKMLEAQQRRNPKKACSARAKEMWKDPVYRSVVKNSLIEGNKRAWKNKVKRKQRIKNITKALNEPKVKIKRSMAMRNVWKNAQYRQAVEKVLKNNRNKRSNKCKN